MYLYNVPVSTLDALICSTMRAKIVPILKSENSFRLCFPMA